ncbi:MAG: hypothetical protein Fur003_3360 [Candidatus Dojkabacteria bacterium]
MDKVATIKGICKKVSTSIGIRAKVRARVKFCFSSIHNDSNAWKMPKYTIPCGITANWTSINE